MIGTGCLTVALYLGGHAFYSTKITWSRDVSRIVYRHCASCHQPGGSSFPLVTFAQARPWAEDIKQQVLQRRMPPWNAVKGFGEFKDDAGLTQEDLEIIGEWVDGGMPEGNPAYLPPVEESQGAASEDPAEGHRMTVPGRKVIEHEMEAIGIVPDVLPPTGAMQVIARAPDGAIEPLIWIEKFNPEFKQTYYFREPLRFARGTKIEITPSGGRVDLVIRRSAK
jgi:hypothetical protein